MTTDTLDGQSLLIAGETSPGAGEDSYTARTDSEGGLLCVADGCGGIGSRRYEKMEKHTGAYLASRLGVECVCAWARAMDGKPFPRSPDEAAQWAAELGALLKARFVSFQADHASQQGSRIVVSMQRALPTTLCLALLDARARADLHCLFLWAGDSRGYVLDASGLRQCTADHVAGRTDAMENLYHESRLSNFVCADRPFELESRLVSVAKPCVVLTATDGAFAYLPTPMEFELLLLSTLKEAKTLDGWRRRLQTSITRVASDDSTLVLSCFGFHTFEQLQAHYAARRAELQRIFVTPVRRRRQSVEFARERWKEYRLNYEMSGAKDDEDRGV
ncbi:MAG: protein phosphatase 2C domain-containing protein [Eubacteriales bacterium]|nr:protein phosphatase 2C domain-containing protein [Eubacteriales bacterium]